MIHNWRECTWRSSNYYECISLDSNISNISKSISANSNSSNSDNLFFEQEQEKESKYPQQNKQFKISIALASVKAGNTSEIY